MSDETADLLNPTMTPQGVGKKTGVRRVNNVPMYLVGGALVLFLIAFALVAMDRAEKQNQKVEEQAPKIGSTRNIAAEIAGKHFNAVAMPDAEPPREAVAKVDPAPAAVPAPAPAASGQPSVPVVRLDVPPMPPRNAGDARPPYDENADRLGKMKLQNLEAALKARTPIQVNDSRNRAGAAAGAVGGANVLPPGVTSKDPMEVYKARLAQVRANIPGLAAGAEGTR